MTHLRDTSILTTSPRPRGHLTTVVDVAWQTIFRLAFPLACAWWRLRPRRHEGALVAVHVGQSLLLLRSSYRRAWNFPGGGVRRGETPEAAARRELAEEVGIIAQAPLCLTDEISGSWEGRQERVYIFKLHLDHLPQLTLDNREIIGAQLVPIAELGRQKVTGPVTIYIARRLGITFLVQGTPPAPEARLALGR